MNYIIYRLEQGKPVSLMAQEQQIEAALAMDETIWVEVISAETDELKPFLEMLQLHPLIIEDCLSSRHSTLIERYPNTVYLEFPTNISAEADSLSYLSIICVPGVVVSLPRGPIPKLNRDALLLQSDIPLKVGTTAELLLLLLEVFIEGTVSDTLQQRQRLIELEHQLNQEPVSLEARDVVLVKQAVRQLETIAEDQVYCLRGLAMGRDEAVLAVKAQQVYFDDLLGDAEYGLRSLTRLNDRVKELQGNLEIHRRETSEKRLRALTIISALMLPLTFLTGYFGMNFNNMFLLEWEFGLEFASGIMLVMVGLLLVYFYRNHWFD